MQTENAAENITEEFSEASESPGEVLREERLRQGLTEKEVADELHITMHYVKAIEANAYEKLPGAIFAKGYVKSYAELLKLDTNSTLELFAEFTNQQIEKEKQKTLIQVRKRRDKNRPWVVLSIVGFVGGFTGLWAYNNFVTEGGAETDTSSVSVREPLNPSIPTELTDSVETEQQASPGQSGVQDRDQPALEVADQLSAGRNINAAEEISNTVAPSRAPADLVSASLAPEETDFVAVLASLANESWPQDNADGNLPQTLPSQGDAPAGDSEQIITISANGSDLLRISFSGESWVEIIDEEQNPIYRDIRSAGDIVEVTGNAPFSILLGDAPFTRLTFNGNEIDVSDNIRIDNSARLTVGL